jgi:hypothetical protein
MLKRLAGVAWFLRRSGCDALGQMGVRCLTCSTAEFAARCQVEPSRFSLLT